MKTNELKTALTKASAELQADGWINICTVLTSDVGLAYGSLYTKDGVRFYLNKDTIMPNTSGPDMAMCCKPIFNKI